MAYRNDKEALEERIAALEAKLTVTSQETQSLQQELTAARGDLAKLQRPEPANKAGIKIWILVAVFVAVGALFIGILSDSDTPPPELAGRAPLGLKGLKFGMTPPEARSILKQIKPVPTEGQCEEKEQGDSMLESWEARQKCRDEAERWSDLEASALVPGPRRALETLLHGEPTHCLLSFGVQGGLSRVACRIDVPPHLGRQAWNRITTQLHQRWGPSSRSGEQALGGRSFSWESPEASLDAEFGAFNIGGQYLGETTNKILIINTWRKHIDAHETAAARAGEEEERQRIVEERKAREAAERARQEYIERLKRLESGGVEQE